VEALDGLPAHKLHCSVLAEEAVKAAVKDYYDKNGIAYGNILDLKGTIIGKHRGLPRYTLGQHRGLGLPTEEPLYVCGKDTAANTLTVGPPAALYARGLTARECAWGALPALTAPTRVEVQTRYRQHPRPALALPAGENAFRVVFDQPERAVTPGQTVVLYDGELVLAAGTIDRPEA
jgi:tRNA-specific 2-thiouridylase